jgi:hypothetical protein
MNPFALPFGTSTARPVEEILEGDRTGQVNVLTLLAQSLYEAERGNDDRALLYFGTALLALKYKKASYALQGALVVDRAFGEVTGKRPLEALREEFER